MEHSPHISAPEEAFNTQSERYKAVTELSAEGDRRITESLEAIERLSTSYAQILARCTSVAALRAAELAPQEQ